MFITDKKIDAFEKKVWLASPTMHGEELEYMTRAYTTNWMSTVGENINAVERFAAGQAGVKGAVGLTCGTAALHMCMRYAGIKLYGKPDERGALYGHRVFCTDMTFDATVNPIVYEGGTPVFIDTDRQTWNMDPEALEKAFIKYPEVKLVVYAQLYGFSADMDRIRKICDDHGALLIEDAAEALGAKWRKRPCGSFGDYAAISYNGNKIITGSSGGCFLSSDEEAIAKIRKWSTQARENAPWYQHEELGFNYRMSNVIAGVIRGQYYHLFEHLAGKKAIYERYREGLKGLPVSMNPILSGCEPNYWLSAMIIDKDALCVQTRTDNSATYTPEHNKSCPTEILEKIAAINAEGRPIWKPMHMQPIYKDHDFISLNEDCGADIFERGLCLPSDINMTKEQQEKIIEVIRACFN